MKATLITSNDTRLDVAVDAIREDNVPRWVQASGVSTRWAFELVHPEMSNECYVGAVADIVVSTSSGESVGTGFPTTFKPDGLVSTTAECTAVKSSTTASWIINVTDSDDIDPILREFDANQGVDNQSSSFADSLSSI